MSADSIFKIFILIVVTTGKIIFLNTYNDQKSDKQIKKWFILSNS